MESNASPDVSLFTGGLLRHVLRGAGLRDAALRRIRVVSVLLAPAVAWVPLLVLTAIAGTLLPKSASESFLVELGVHVRLLVVLPLLILGGLAAEARIRPTLEQFVGRGLIDDRDLERFQEISSRAFRLGDSVVVDVVLLVLILAIATPVFWRTHGSSALTWYSVPTPTGPRISPAGIWFAYVSLPIFQFLLLRWYYRLFIWAWFLRRTAKLGLRLIPPHPDRVGGLGFLVLATQGLMLFAMAHGALLAGRVAKRVVIDHQVLTAFKDETLLVVGFVLCITMLPLLAFSPPLILAKRRGTLQYGALASRYAREFDDKWIRSQANPSEPLIGSADVQSMADMGGTYELVAAMRSTPIALQNVLAFAIVTLIPVAPLLLTAIPLEQLLKKLIGILF